MRRPGQDECGSRGIAASLSTAERDFHSPILRRTDGSCETATAAQVTSSQSTATFPPPFTAAERRGEGDRHQSAARATRPSHHLPRQEWNVAMARPRPRRLDDSTRSPIGDLAPHTRWGDRSSSSSQTSWPDVCVFTNVRRTRGLTEG